MWSWDDDRVTIRRLPTGTVVVGEASPAPAGTGGVALTGARAYVDPSCPTQPPTVEVADASWAFSTVSELYGEEVAMACLELQDRDVGTEERVSVLWRRGELLADLADLGVLHWLAQWAPWPLDRGLLDLETLVAGTRCLRILEDPDAVIGRIVDCLDDLLTLGANPTLPPPVTDLVRAGIEVAAAHVELADPRRLMAAEVLARNLPDRPSPAVPDRDALAAHCLPARAPHAGDRPDLFVGSDTVDWFRTPIGTLPRDEAAVSWSAEVGPLSSRMTIAVTSPPPPTTNYLPFLITPVRAVALAVAVHADDWPFPLAVCPLEVAPADAESGYLCVVELGAAASQVLDRALNAGGRVVIDVHDASRPSHAPARPERAEAMRWSARALAASRLLAVEVPEVTDASDAQQPDPMVRASATRAQRLWRLLSTDESPAVVSRDSARADVVESLPRTSAAAREAFGAPTVTEVEATAR